MRHLLVLVIPALLLTGCPQGEPAVPRSGTAAPDAALGPDVVVLEAEMSHMGLQHPMSFDLAAPERVASYVVIDRSEVTVYADKRISCPAKVRLTGRWTSASGDKGGQHVVERQFVADRWECLP